MIDPLTEHIVSLTEASRLLPARRGGKRPHVSCLYRWTTSGCRGVILEAIQIGGTRCTSREALARFFARLTHRDDPRDVHHSDRRQRAAMDTERELDREGL